MPPNTAPAGGKWLFKRGELLLGPVPPDKVTELLYSGEIDGETPMKLHGGDASFRPLREIEQFKVHVAKASAKLRVEDESVVKKKKERSGRVVRLLVIGVLTAGALGGGVKGAFWLAIHRPWEKQIQLPDPVITDELPQIKLASARQMDELSYPGVGNKPVAKLDKRPNGKNGTPATPKVPGSTTRPQQADEDGLSSMQNWDMDAINGVVKANKKSLHPCLMTEARKQKSGWSSRVPIEFTIGNDGKITKLWIDNPEFKGESNDLYKCMLGALQKWRFPAYNGEQANVSLAFSIRAP